MKRFKISIALVSASLLLSAPVQAMPDTVEEMRTIIQTEFGGNANAYVEEERSDFRRMACRGRTDMLQAMLDDGLVLAELSHRTYSPAALCALNQEEMAAVELLVTPDYITAHEMERAGESTNATLIWNRIYADDYEMVRYLLEHGVHTSFYDDYWNGLTREEHLLLAAESALDHEKEDAIRAFYDAGFGHIMDAARNEDNVRYVRNRLRPAGGGGGGGLFRTLAGGLAGAYLGGTTGAAIGILEGGTSGSNDNKASSGPQNSGPLPLATNRAELGLQISQVTTPQRGLEVHDVIPGGSAAAAGIMTGDIIVSIAGEPVASRGSLYVATEKAADMTEYEVAYLRGGELATVVFGPPPPEAPAAEVEAASEAAAATAPVANAPATTSKLEDLDRLGDLRDRGILSEEEFEVMKAEILARP